MRYAKLMSVAACAFGIAALASCSVVPLKPQSVMSAGKAVPADKKPEAPVSRAAQDDYSRALNAIKAGRDKEAEVFLLAMSRAYPDLSGPRANLGILYFRHGRLPEAEQALNMAIKINPDRAVYHNQLGILYRTTGRFKEAGKEYEKALQLDPGYAYAYLNIGILYDIYLDDPAKALAYYEHYQQLQPQADKLVTKWIADLKQRSQTADKTGKKVSG